MSETLRIMLAIMSAKECGFTHFALALEQLLKRRMRTERALQELCHALQKRKRSEERG